MRAAGFSYSTNPIKAPPNGQVHLAKLTDKVSDWSTNPPDGGQHYFTPAPFNFYDDAVPAKIAVHNQEHGGVIIWYGPKISAATKDQLRDFWQESPNGILATPYAPLEDKIALTAWTATRAATSGMATGARATSPIGTRFDEKAFTAFRDAFRGKGPERFPLAAMTPGHVARGPHEGTLPPAPGWRNWRYAPDLKSGVPCWGREGSTPSPGIASGSPRLRRAHLGHGGEGSAARLQSVTPRGRRTDAVPAALHVSRRAAAARVQAHLR